MATKPAWYFREMNRFLDGTYKCPPWDGCPTCLESNPGVKFERLPRIELHAAHISPHDNALIAYTKTPEDGEKDRQVRVKPGRYLQKYYKHLTPQQIAFYASLMGMAAKNSEESKVLIATTADEIEHVYMNGPSSCMTHQVRNYRSNPVHPVRAYEGPDLRVAYIMNPAKGKIAARCIVYPEKKIFCRIYGDGGAFSARLRALLLKDGYKEGVPYGARIKILRDNRTEMKIYEYIVPYIDGVQAAIEKDGYLVLQENGYIPMNRPDGVSCPPRKRCSHCGGTFTLHIPEGTVHASLCDTCRQTQIVRCEHGDHEVLKNDIMTVNLAGGRTVDICRACAGTKYRTCQSCTLMWEVEVCVSDTAGRTVCADCRNDLKKYAGSCTRCEKPVAVKETDKDIKDKIMCKYCAHIIRIEERVKNSTVKIRPEIMELTHEFKDLDPIELQVALDDVIENIRGVYTAA